MIHKIFIIEEEMMEFLKIYYTYETIISIDTLGKFHVWINFIKYNCPHCKKDTDASGKYCAYCGNEI